MWDRIFLFPWQLSWSCPQHKGILRKWHSGVFAKDALEDYSHKLQRGITLLNQFRLTSHLLLIERAENSDSGFGSPLDERLSMPSLCLGKTLCLHFLAASPCVPENLVSYTHLLVLRAKTFHAFTLLGKDFMPSLSEFQEGCGTSILHWPIVYCVS